MTFTEVFRNPIMIQVSYGTRMGIIWLKHNEVYIYSAPWQRKYKRRFIGTYPTYELAKKHLEIALKRAHQS